jgi:RAB protein geranylgeranyltransferase component A
MSNPTSAFGWQMPTSSDLVTDLPADFEVFGQAVDTSLADLKGGTTGQVLSKASGTDMDFTWIEQDDSTLAFTAQTGTTYTLVAADAQNKLVTTSNASAVTVTVPPSVFSTGNTINVQSIGVGITTFAQGAGVTITSTGATSTAPNLRARYSACTIICTGSNTFTIVGDLS